MKEIILGATGTKWTAMITDHEKIFEILDDEPDWLIDELLPPNGIAALSAPTNVGKSFLMLHWAMSLVAGLPQVHGRFNINAPEPINAVYFDGELNRYVQNRRLCAWYTAHDDKLTDEMRRRLVLNLHIFQNSTVLLGTEDQKLFEALREAFPEPKDYPNLIVLDTYSSLIDADDRNAEGQVQKVLNEASAIQNHFSSNNRSCLVVFVAHHNKNTGKERTAAIRARQSFSADDAISGSARLARQCEQVLEFFNGNEKGEKILVATKNRSDQQTDTRYKLFLETVNFRSKNGKQRGGGAYIRDAVVDDDKKEPKEEKPPYSPDMAFFAGRVKAQNDRRKLSSYPESDGFLSQKTLRNWLNDKADVMEMLGIRGGKFAEEGKKKEEWYVWPAYADEPVGDEHEIADPSD